MQAHQPAFTIQDVKLDGERCSWFCCRQSLVGDCDVLPEESFTAHHSTAFVQSAHSNANYLHCQAFCLLPELNAISRVRILTTSPSVLDLG